MQLSSMWIEIFAASPLTETMLNVTKLANHMVSTRYIEPLDACLRM